MESFDLNMISYFNEAIQKYKASIKEKFALESADPWVLFVIEDCERNVIDQKLIETALQAKYGVKSMRHTFKEISQLIEFDKDTHVMKVRGKEIGFVYYRCGYQVE